VREIRKKHNSKLILDVGEVMRYHDLQRRFFDRFGELDE
jgi:hypothetical protein